MKARDYQLVAEDAIFNGFDAHPSQLLVMATGLGKCLGRGTPVLMSDGTVKAVEDVGVGDLLMGPDSRPRRVLSLASGREMMYRVTPNKGDAYTVNESHILSLMLTPARHGQARRLVNIGVRDYLAESRAFRHRAKGWRTAVDWPERHVPLDPYYLGIWLGDGNIRTANVHKPDAEIGAAVAAVAVEYGMKSERRQYGHFVPYWTLSQDGGGGRHKPNPVTWRLRGLGVTNGKHIPHLYKANSRAVRLEVLAGLMDTDGNMTDKGFDFVSVSPRLAHDVAFLARSLGMAAYVKKCRKSCQGGFTGDYYRLNINGHTDMIPTRIKRKQAPARRQIKDVLVTGITVEPNGVGDYFGFEIDGDRLFMLGDFTVTHNTVVMGHVAERWARDGRPGRVLMVAHREELIRQSADKFERVTGSLCGVEMADERSGHVGPVAVATVQTLQARLGKFRPNTVGLLMIDEAHHAIAGSYRKVIAHFTEGNPACRVLGVTATPKRADDLAMGQVFGHCCFDYGIAAAVEDGWLVPVVQRAIRCKGLDFSKCRQTAGDLNEGDLDEIVREEKVLHEVCSPLIREAGDRPTLVFAVTVAHAHALAAVIDRYRPGSAVAMDGKTDREVRRRQVARFKNREYQFLVNCGLFLEGFDAPATQAVAMARPTKSLALYTQVLGRGTRPLPGVVDGEGLDTAGTRRAAIANSDKSHMLVLDFVGNSGRHKIVTAQDVLGGKYGQPVRDYGAALAEDDEDARGRPVDEVLDRAAAEVAFLAECREMARRRMVTARAEYDAERVSAFQGGQRQGVPPPAVVPGEPATDKQIGYLSYRCGWKREDARRLTKRQASAIIGKHREAEEATR